MYILFLFKKANFKTYFWYILGVAFGFFGLYLVVEKDLRGAGENFFMYAAICIAFFMFKNWKRFAGSFFK